MTIDMSPMSVILTAALFIVGIPAIILSIVAWIMITRSFYRDRDYEREMPAATAEQAPAQHPGGRAPHADTAA